MRVIAVIVGGLLLIGGGVLVAVADQQRVAALEDTKAAVEELRQEFETTQDENAELDEVLATLRSQIAEQEKQFVDTTGLLQ